MKLKWHYFLDIWREKNVCVAWLKYNCHTLIDFDQNLCVCVCVCPIGCKASAVACSWTWPSPGILRCSTPGLRVPGQTSPFQRWAVNWPQGQSVRLKQFVSFVCMCVRVCESQHCDLIYPDKATGPTKKKSIFFLSFSLWFPPSLCASGRIGLIKENKSIGRVASPENRF